MKVPARFKVGITRYTAADADDLLAFQLRTFGPGVRQVDTGRAAWLFDRNPCRSEDATRDLWVCRRDDAVVGQQAEIPFDLKAGSHERRAAWAVDLMVDDAWRLRGVGPALVSTQLDHRPIVAGLNLSDKGHATYTRGGWTDLGIVPVYLRPLDLGRAVAAGLGAGAHRPPLAGRRTGPARRRQRRPGRAARRGRPARADRRLRRAGRRGVAGRVPHYPVLARRDAASLRWRIDDRPDQGRMQRYYLVARGRTVGYVVLRPAGTAVAPTAVIVDYLAAPRWVAPLLVAAGGVARRQGAVALSVKTRNEPADRQLRAAGFVRRDRGTDEPVRFMVHCTDAAVSALVDDPANWFVTSADSDLEYAMTPGGADVASSGPTTPAATPPTATPPSAAPVADGPSTDSPATDSPVTDSPVTDAPAAAAPPLAVVPPPTAEPTTADQPETP